jgi:putative ABC transport system ATP-binding protein
VQATAGQIVGIEAFYKAERAAHRRHHFPGSQHALLGEQGRGRQPGVTPLFALEHVLLEIDGATILDDVCCEIPDDGITVLLGPSGSGKTTILRLLNRLEVPTEGVVRFRGEPVDELDPLRLRRRVGMVFQRPAVFPGTVQDNLDVACPPHCPPDVVASVLNEAGLATGLLDRVADDLSGGEAQRLCLARTLATEPEVLLMDEPTSSLDPDARRHLERTALSLAAKGMPMVWVTHDLDQADRLSHHRVVVVAGRIADPTQAARYLADADDDGEDGDG